MLTTLLLRRNLRLRPEAGVGTAEYVSAIAFLLISAFAWLSIFSERMTTVYAGSGNALGGGNGVASASQPAGNSEGGKQCPGGSCSCFVAGTLVDTAEGSKPIESVRLGDRVGPESAECADLRTDGWLEVDLRVPVHARPTGEDLQVSLLRPTAWFAEKPASVGDKILVHVEELKIQGEALVTGVRWASPLKPGARCPVTGLVRHVSSDVIAVALKGGSTLEVTKHHPLYSADRDAWVEAGELAAGEDLVTRGEVARVDGVFDVPRAPTEVFNLEVTGEHRYFVGEMRVLAHNVCTGPADPGSSSSPWAGISTQGASSSGGSVVHRIGGGSSIPDRRTGPSLLDALDSPPPAADQASTSNPAPSPASEPALSPEPAPAPAYTYALTPRTDLPQSLADKLMEREKYYGALLDALDRTISEQPFGTEREANEAALEQVRLNYDDFLNLLEYSPSGDDRVGFMDAEKDAIAMMRTTDRMRQEVAELCLSNPEALSKIDDFDLRQTATENMVAKMAQDQLDALNKLPLEALPGRDEFLNNLKATAGDMKNDIKLAQTEAAIQEQVAETLGQALVGAGQAEIDDSLGVGHKIGKVIGPWASEVIQIDTRRPNERVSDQINRTYEPFFHAKPDGNKNFDLSPNPSAKGRLSNGDFVASLDNGLRRKHEKNGFVVGTATDMAVEASPHVDRVGPRPGEPDRTQHVILSPEATARIDELRNKTGAPADKAPADRLADVGKRAAEERQLNELKISLQQTFGPRITQLRNKADSIFNMRPELSGQKVAVLEVTMDELMRCKTRDEMLETIAATRAEHNHLVESQMIPARGGHTAATLDDMEQSVTRFFGD